MTWKGEPLMRAIERKLSRREAFKLAAASTAALTVASYSRAAQPVSKKPNILFIMADQYRGDCVGADGNDAIITPNLDRIAREGVLFSRAYTSTPSCTPARAGLLSGLSPWNHGTVSYTHLRAHETVLELVCRLLLEKKKSTQSGLLYVLSELVTTN